MADNRETRFPRVGVASSESSVYLSSSEDFECSCDSCKSRGGHVEALGYCVECAEYLCESCIRHHIKNKTLKRHVLLHLHRITDVSDVRTNNNTPGRYLSADVKSSDFDSTGDLSNLTFRKDINVKLSTDSADCSIIGMAMLSDDSMVVGDSNNKSIKVIDIKNDTVQDSVKLRGRPFSLSLLSNDELAVTLTDEQMINILSVTNGLNVGKTIRVDGLCYDVVSFKDRLLVSCSKPLMFEIMDLNGRVVEKVVPAPDVSSLCTVPAYIALSPDEKTLFISDWKNNVCLSIDMKGNKIAENTDIKIPFAIVCSSAFDCIILCESDTHCIRKMTMNLQGGEILLNRGDGLSTPRVLCVCPKLKQLIVSSFCVEAEDCNCVKVFQF